MAKKTNGTWQPLHILFQDCAGAAKCRVYCPASSTKEKEISFSPLIR